MPKRKKTVIYIIFGIFIILFAVRFIHLSADPPYDLSTSGGPYGDPGGYSFNARNKLLYGTYEVDNYNMMYMSYLPHLATLWTFKVFGIGFAQMNLVPVFFSGLILIVFFLLLKERFDEFLAILGATLLGMNYLFLMFSRVANRIMPSLFFFVLGLYLLQKGKKKPGWVFIAGISFAVAILSKSVLFYALLAVLVGYFLYLVFNVRNKQLVQHVAFLFFGALIPLIPYFVFLYLPYREFTQSFSRINVQYLLPPTELSLLLRHFWTRPALLLQFMPLLSILAAMCSLILLKKSVTTPKKMHMEDWMFFGWFIMGTFYYSIIQQRVTRHFVPHIIPLVFLTIALVHILSSTKIKERVKKPGLLFGVCLFLWSIYPVSLLLKFISEKFPSILASQMALYLALFTLSMIFSLSILFLSRTLNPPKFAYSSSKLKTALLVVLLGGVLLFQGTQYISWAVSPRFQFSEISQDYALAFKKATFAGLWAPVISLENKHRAHEYFPGLINDDKNFFDKYGITHVFTTTSHGEDKTFERQFPEIMEQAKLLARYHIWTTEVLLYDIHPGKEDSTAGHFEAEVYTRPGSTPRFDAEASQNFAVLHKKKSSDFMLVVPLKEFLPEGRYEVLFRMKRESQKSRSSGRIVRLDAVSENIRRVYSHEDILSENFPEGEYHNFRLVFYLSRPRKIELRVFAEGRDKIWADWIKVQKID